MRQNTIKDVNDNLDKIIDKSKSFEEQIKSLKKRKGVKGYQPYKEYGDKQLKYKYFKIELAKMSNEIDERFFEQIFGHTLIRLGDKLINRTNKDENQIIAKNIDKNKYKIYKEDEFVIQPQQRADLKYTIDLILDFNEKFNQIWFKNTKMNELFLIGKNS